MDVFCFLISARLGKKGRVQFAFNDDNVLFRFIDEFEQIALPQSLVANTLHFNHYAEMTGHLGGQRLYQSLSRNFFSPKMSLNCYLVVQCCVSCASDRVAIWRNSKSIQLLPGTALLEFLAIDIWGQLLTTMKVERSVLVVLYLLSKLV